MKKNILIVILVLIIGGVLFWQFQLKERVVSPGEGVVEKKEVKEEGIVEEEEEIVEEEEETVKCGKIECVKKGPDFYNVYGPADWTDKQAECICRYYTPEEWKLRYCGFGIGEGPLSDEERQIWKDCGVFDLPEGYKTVEPADLIQLTFLGNAADPDWSPAGSQIAFHDFNKNRIGIINVDGTGLRYLDIGGDPNWSPIENKLAVMAWKEEQILPNLGIYLVDIDTEETTFLVMGNQACWSSDGTKIAYSLDEGGLSSIWVINSDGSGKTRLTFEEDGYCTGLSFSHDGSKIVYVKGLTDYGAMGEYKYGPNEIWVMDSDSSNKHQIYAPGDSSSLIFQRSWNKDNKILFMHRGIRRADPKPSVWVINSDGSDPHPVVQNPQYVCGDPVWNNDGTKVAIFSKGNVWTFPYK